MLHRILDQRLQCQRGHLSLHIRGVDIDLEEEFLGIAYLQQIAIRIEELQLVSNGRKGVLPVLNDVAEHVRESVDVGKCLLVVLLAHQHRERVERVEQEVRADLAHQRAIAGREVLGFELFVLDLDALTLIEQVVDAGVEYRHHVDEHTLEHQYDIERVARYVGLDSKFRSGKKERNDDQQTDRIGQEIALPDCSFARSAGHDREHNEHQQSIADDLQCGLRACVRLVELSSVVVRLAVECLDGE